MIILLLGSLAFSGSLFFTQIEKNGFSVIMETMIGNLKAKNDKKSNDKKSSVQNEGKHGVSNKDNSSKVKNDMGTLVQNAGKNYISENITSAVGKDKRSNRARFSLMEAEIKVWMDHPVLGVGKGLKAAYIPDKLPSDATKSGEVKMWLDRLHANGALKASFPDVSEYTSRLCEIGLLGCILYYFPAVYLAYFFLLFLRRSRDNKQYLRIQSLLSFYLISLAGILAGGITTSLNVNYCFGVLLGIGFILHHQVKKLKFTKIKFWGYEVRKIHSFLAKFTHDFSYSFLLNIVNLLIKTSFVFILPKLIGVEDFGYWQLYFLYTFFIAFGHLGLVDGIYLKMEENIIGN